MFFITKTMARQTAGLLNGQTDNRSGSEDITSPSFPFSLPLFLPSFLPSPLSFVCHLSSFHFSISPISSGILTGLLFLIYFSRFSISLSPSSIQLLALFSAASYSLLSRIRRPSGSVAHTKNELVLFL